MLAALLLVGLCVAPLASLALFLPLRRLGRARGAWPTLRRFAAAVVLTVALCAAAYAVVRALDVTSRHALVAAACFAALSVLLLPSTRSWNGRAHVCWSACTFLYLAYLVFILNWTVHSGLGVGGIVGGLALWVLELVAGIFGAAYLWELCDVLGTEDWRRRVGSPREVAAAAPEGFFPFVSLQVPAHNEPPDMVIATLSALIQQDYPNFEVIALDDNTEDPEIWQPVAAWCESHRVKFVHLSDWPGYKSGALNYALDRMIDPRAELIGVVDSDYQIDPGFLRSCAPLFADPYVGFVQAPQDYRDWQQDSYYRRLYYSYRYFFAVSQPSRNEHNSAIFAGTMGLIRRDALQQLGGWDEWCITEDAELSLRLMRAGWGGLHIDQSFGRGVMPLTFEALKSQRYRWCFGGIQILRKHARALLTTSADNKLTRGQRWGYFAGGVQWYGDLIGLLFYIFMLAGAVNLALGGGQLFRKLTVFLVAAVPVLIVLGLIRAVALLRRGTGASWRDAIGAFFIWQATSVVVARASVQGLFAKQAVFLRTPKTFDQTGAWQVLRANAAESVLALCGVAGMVVGLARADTLSGPLLAALLLVPTLGFAAAPYNSLAAQRAALPPDLRRRRRTEYLRNGAVAGAVAGGGVAVAVGAVAIIALLLAPGARNLHTPTLVPDKHSSGHHSTAPPRPSSPAPTTSAPGSSSAPPSSSPPASTSAPATSPTSSPPASPPASTSPPASSPPASPTS